MRVFESKTFAAACVAVSLVGGPFGLSAAGQGITSDSPRVLVVVAHPDDDAAFTGVLYQVTHQLDGVVDLALVTDGSGGFRYSTLAEEVYGLKLTDETVARQHLPTVRKRELLAGGAIVGVSKYFFFDQLDDAFTQDPEPALTSAWDADWVRQRLVQIMQTGAYDLILAHAPFEEAHGHHKGATILALEAAQMLPVSERPVVLGGFGCALGDQVTEFAGVDGYPITRASSGRPIARFDRTQTFGFNDRLNFEIIGNWVIAEHKSQGVMQLRMSQLKEECYWSFDVNPGGSDEAVETLFENLQVDRSVP